MSIAGHDRRLLRVAKKGWARDNSLARVVFAVERERRQQRAALTLAAVAQILTSDEPSVTMQVETSPGYEPLPAPRRESAPPIIPGSTNDPNSSAYDRPWVQEPVEMPDPHGPGMPTGPWAHWGFEPPPSYAQAAEDTADSDTDSANRDK